MDIGNFSCLYLQGLPISLASSDATSYTKVDFSQLVPEGASLVSFLYSVSNLSITSTSFRLSRDNTEGNLFLEHVGLSSLVATVLGKLEQEKKILIHNGVDDSLYYRFTVNSFVQNLTAKVLGWTVPIR